MATVNDPYSDWVKLMQDEGGKNDSPSIELATVVSPAPSLVINKGELPLTSSDLYAYDGYTTLVKGDTVAVLAMTGKQKYIILCKVADLSG